MAYLIWSTEKRKWWGKPRGDMGPVYGYTDELTEAGVFTYEHAAEICDHANKGLKPGEPLEEVMFQLPPFPMGRFRK